MIYYDFLITDAYPIDEQKDIKQQIQNYYHAGKITCCFTHLLEALKFVNFNFNRNKINVKIIKYEMISNRREVLEVKNMEDLEHLLVLL